MKAVSCPTSQPGAVDAHYFTGPWVGVRQNCGQANSQGESRVSYQKHHCKQCSLREVCRDWRYPKFTPQGCTDTPSVEIP